MIIQNCSVEDSMEKVCVLCANSFYKKSRFSNKQWASRRYCSKYCSNKINRDKRIYTDKDREKISAIAKQRGYGKWSKGRHLSDDHKKKLRDAFLGARSVHWKGGITPLNQRIRHSFEYKLWRKAVFERDKYYCVFCGHKGGKLEADHVKPFSLYPELRFAIDNGRTLCKKCHKIVTKNFMKKYWQNQSNKSKYLI